MCLPSGLQRGWRSFLAVFVSWRGSPLSVGASQREDELLLPSRSTMVRRVDDELAVGTDLRIADALEAEQVVDLHRPLALGEDGGRRGQQKQTDTQHGGAFHEISFLAKDNVHAYCHGAMRLARGAIDMIKTKRWDDRARGRRRVSPADLPLSSASLPKKKETWDLWWSQLGPSKELHAAFYGKHGQTPISLGGLSPALSRRDEGRGSSRRASPSWPRRSPKARRSRCCVRRPARMRRIAIARLLKQLIEEQVSRLRLSADSCQAASEASVTVSTHS